MSCRKKQLKNIPPLPRNTSTALVSDNLITTIHTSDFGGCLSLIHLDLSHNHIELIDQDSFAYLHNLLVFHINDNRLNFNVNTSLPHQTFAPLASLLNLQMHNNIWYDFTSCFDIYTVERGKY